MPSCCSTEPAGIRPAANSRCQTTSASCTCRPIRLNSIRSKTSGSSCDRTNSATASSTATPISSMPAAMPGTHLPPTQAASVQSPPGHGHRLLSDAVGITLLRPSTQQPRTVPVFDGVVRLIANHLDLPIFGSTPKVRALCSAGITRHQRFYDPVRLPPWPSPVATLRPLPSHRSGLPRLLEPPFRRAVPTTPADRAGARVDCFPAHAAFPKWQEGRHPHCHFRGLLRLHSCYVPSDCSAA